MIPARHLVVATSFAALIALPALVAGVPAMTIDVPVAVGGPVAAASSPAPAQPRAASTFGGGVAARTPVTLAQRMSATPVQPMLGMANRSDLSTRVTAVLDDRLRRGRAGFALAAGTVAAAAIVVMTVAPGARGRQSRAGGGSGGR